MSLQPDTTRLETLILARLYPKRKSPMQPGDLLKFIEPLLESQLTPPERKAFIEQTLEGLKANVLITRKPLAITEKGRNHLFSLLGVAVIPENIRPDALIKNYLNPHFLSISNGSAKVKERLKSSENLAGFILKKHYSLACSEAPTSKQALDSLLWRQLGVETDKPFTLKNVQLHLLSPLLGAPPKVDPKKLPGLMAAKPIKARGSSASDLQSALLRSWLWPSNGASAPAQPQPPSPSPAIPTPPGGFDLGDFAHRVLAAAQDRSTHHFGDNKAFIGSVWQNMQSEPICQGMSLDSFKSHLVEANQKGFLALCRADLIAAMDPKDVAESETHYLNAVFHFVELIPGRH